MTEKNKLSADSGINTRLAHLGHDPQSFHGFVNPPVVHASTVLFPDAQSMTTNKQKYTYGTHGTPTTDALCEAINALEGSEGTILLPSGLAAVTIPFLSYLSAGDHVLVVDSVYGPTRRFCNGMLKRLGIETTYYHPDIGAGIESLIKSNTKLVHTEAPGSHTFEMSDIGAIAAAAHKHNCVVTMDNTWATPLFFKPLDHGVDVSIHAATKFPGGHSDILMGTVSANKAHWQRLYDANTDLGMCVGGDDAYQILRGLRTMGIRLERHQESTVAIAEWLETREDVAQVLHPALPSFKGHDIWKRDFCGSSSLFSIVLKADHPDLFTPKAQAFLNALKLFGLGYSWGGYECLAVHSYLKDRTVCPAPTAGPVIRLQIGLEDVVDIRKDIEAGLAAAALIN